MRNEILKMLENNSRIDLHDLAIMLGTDESMVLRRIEKMENEGIICGYPTRRLTRDKNRYRKSNRIIRSSCYPTKRAGI